MGNNFPGRELCLRVKFGTTFHLSPLVWGQLTVVVYWSFRSFFFQRSSITASTPFLPPPSTHGSTDKHWRRSKKNTGVRGQSCNLGKLGHKRASDGSRRTFPQSHQMTIAPSLRTFISHSKRAKIIYYLLHGGQKVSRQQHFAIGCWAISKCFHRRTLFCKFCSQ